ncbi:MAG TPA: uroporphyrinogen-III C-methyltransferase [Kofleriaceae bacterium]|nr:uroporphyrinogen-III C-methyltransferase [Kofleriaceae bacterium]
MSDPRGCVYLVGAGPGDPGLLTVRAHELVRGARVLAHDELVSPEILALAPPDCERIAVGRRAGHGTTAFRLHPAVVERARAGHAVVRLKCGDPLVFGRGGEEAEELATHGIRFELVPGVSAALGAAAYAGIPLTHRDCASSVRLVTACTAGEPHGETVVIYMSGRRVAASLGELGRAGRPATTPAAWIAAATTPRQRIVVGTIGDLGERVAATDDASLLVVGDVVARRTPWWERTR